MKAVTNVLGELAAQRWLMWGCAAVMAAGLLMAFIDTLQDNIRRGEELRQAQRVSSVRQTISTVADATTTAQPPQLR